MDSTDESKSFFKHVFNFDDDSKSEILMRMFLPRSRMKRSKKKKEELPVVFLPSPGICLKLNTN